MKSNNKTSFAEIFERNKPDTTVTRKSPSATPPLTTDYNGNVTKPYNHSPKDEWFNTGVPKKIRAQLRKGKIKREASLDLHGFKRDEAIEQTKNFLYQAYCNQKRCVKIIFGVGFRSPKGQSVLRPSVQSYLPSNCKVVGYTPALDRDGGNGAAYILLKSHR